jgi:hypothetical protein
LLPVKSPPGAGVEPPESAIRAVICRPLSGISVTVCWSIVCLNDASSVCKARPLACTSIFWSVRPTVIGTLIEMLLPTSRTIFDWV